MKDYYEIFCGSMSWITNVRTLLGYREIIQTQFNGEHQPSSEEHLCTAIWYQSNLIEYTPWIVIPCNQVYFTIATICETGVNPDIVHDLEKRSVVTNKHQLGMMWNISHYQHLTIVAQNACPPYWTFINDSC